MTQVGKALPRSTLKLPLALSGGQTATLADHAGRWLVLYFYPKDSTPGCTTEGLDFNALLPKFAKLDADVLGVGQQVEGQRLLRLEVFVRTQAIARNTEYRAIEVQECRV